MWNLKFNFSILPERLRTSLLRVNIQFALALLGSVWCGVSLSMFALSKAFIFSNLPHTPFYLLQFANALDLIICFWTWCSSSLESVIAAVPNKFMHFLSGWSEIQDMWWWVTGLLAKLLSDEMEPNCSLKPKHGSGNPPWVCFAPAPDKSTLNCSYLKSKLRKVQIIQLSL